MFTIKLGEYDSAMEGKAISGPEATSLIKALQYADQKYKSDKPTDIDSWGKHSYEYEISVNGTECLISIEYDPKNDETQNRTLITTAIKNFARTSKGIVPKLTKEYYDSDPHIDKTKYPREKWVNRVTAEYCRVIAFMNTKTKQVDAEVVCDYSLPGMGGHVAEVECFNGIFDPNKSYISMQG